jgi:hypothetical protein
LKFSIHQYIVLHYQRKKPKSNFYKTLRTWYCNMHTTINHTNSYVKDKTYIIR